MAGNSKSKRYIGVSALIELSEDSIRLVQNTNKLSEIKTLSLLSLANSMLAIAKILNNVFSTEPNTSAKE